jgi:hypothetical protein
MTDQNRQMEVVPQASQEIIDAAKKESHAWLNPEMWRTMGIVAQTFLQSGAMPKSMDTAPKLMVALQAGKEAGLQPLEAINSFYFVNGKITMYGDMTIAQVLKAGHKIDWINCDDQSATIKITRRDNGATNQVTFTMKMAQERGLTKNTVYKTYPENMLRFKAFHACAKFIVADALHGMKIKEIEEAEYVEEKPVIIASGVVKKANIEPAAISKVESLEEAINKPEPKKVIEDMPKKETVRKANNVESAAAKKMREAKEKAEKQKGGWDEEICRYLRFIDGIADNDLPEDILVLKKDAMSGEFKGYDYYPSLKEQIEMLPKDFK